MRNWQGIVFIWTQTYTDILKSALSVPLMIETKCFRFFSNNNFSCS